MGRRSASTGARAVLVVTISLTIAGFAQGTSSQPGPSGYHLLKTISVGGAEGWDYVTMDSDARRLYIGRDDHIDVVDIDSGTVAGKITGLAHTHGLVIAPALGRGFTSDGEANISTIVDLKTLRKIGTVKTGKDPDSFVYDDITRRVFIMNSAGNDVTAINAADGSVAGTVALMASRRLRWRMVRARFSSTSRTKIRLSSLTRGRWRFCSAGRWLRAKGRPGWQSTGRIAACFPSVITRR
jgi:hypothetical protein